MRNDIIFNDAVEVLKGVDFSPLEGKTVLITGITGLIGTHLLACLSLLKESGMQMSAFGHYHSTPEDYTQQIAARGGICLVRGNDFEPADVIIHAAGYAQPAVFTSNPAETIRINTTLTQKLLDGTKPGGKFLFLSSSEVYNGLDGVVDESQIGTTTPYHIRSCYIEGKRCGEALVNAYKSVVDAKVARLGLTYGPGARPNDRRAMSNFIRQALSSKLLELSYPGKEPRTFCYVRDAVRTFWNVLLHGEKIVYNVGGETVTNMAMVAKYIARIVGVDIHIPAYGGEMPGSGDIRMDVARAEAEFGKQPYVGLEEGLRNTIAWQQGFIHECVQGRS